MFVKILCLLTFFSICLTQTLGQTCDEKGRVRIDTTYAKLLTVGGSGRKFPENKQGQLKKYCTQSIEYLKEADAYKDKCLKQMPKQVTGVVVYSVRNVITQYCKKDSKKLTDLISSSPCTNGAKKEIDQCYTTMVDKFLGASNADPKMKIPHTCCEYFAFLECVSEKALKNKKCSEKQLETFTNWVREMFGNVVDLICSDYTEGSDKCEKIVQTPKKTKSQKRTKSFMLPLIDTISSIEDDF